MEKDGAAERILGMVERGEEHRHCQEQEKLRSDSKARSRGQWMAFTIALLVVTGSIGLIYQGKSWEGLAVGLVPLTTLIGLFIRLGHA
jgi:uncharacterized membrane protein